MLIFQYGGIFQGKKLPMPMDHSDIDAVVKSPLAVIPAEPVPDSDPGAGIHKFLKRLASSTQNCVGR